MKHLLNSMLTICVMLLLTACGTDESKENPSVPEQSLEVMEAQRTINALIRVEMPSKEDMEQDMESGVESGAKSDGESGAKPGRLKDRASGGLFTADLILSHSRVQVLEVTENEWQVKITAPDMQSIADRIRMEVAGLNVDGTDPDEIQHVVEKLTEEIEIILRSGEYDTVETFLRLKVVNGEPIMDEEAVDALYGGLVSVYQDLLQEYMGVMDYVIE